MSRLSFLKVNKWLGSVAAFVEGFTGEGWMIWQKNDKWNLEIDSITVRGTMTIFELLIQKIRAIKGALGITQACGKIKEVTSDATKYYIRIEDEMSFMANDFIRCQQRSLNGVRGYWVKIHSVNEDVLTIMKSEFGAGELPLVGDDIVQFGNLTNTARQSAIYLHANENGIPAIDVLFGINSKTFEGKSRVVLGGFTDNNNIAHYGLSCVNGLMESIDDNGVVKYRINPDGSGFLAMGNIEWKSNGSGSLANGNIAWNADGSGYLFKDSNNVAAISWNSTGLTFGSNVTIQWNNLSNEVKNNLKGERVEFRYKTATSLPTLTNTDRIPSGWNLTASTPAHGEYLYMIFATITSSDSLNGTWSSPARISGEKGDSNYRLNLIPDTTVLTASKDGVIAGSTFASDAARTLLELYYGTSKVQSSLLFSIASSTGGSFALSDTTLRITSMTGDLASCNVEAAVDGIPVASGVFNVSRVKAGQDGTPASTYEIVPSQSVVKRDKYGVPSVSILSFVLFKIAGSTRTRLTSVRTDGVKFRIKRNGIDAAVYDDYANNPYDLTDCKVTITPATEVIDAALYTNQSTWDTQFLLRLDSVPVLRDSESQYRLDLDNETVSVPAFPSGSLLEGALSEAKSRHTLYFGADEVTSGITYAYEAVNVTYSVANKTISILTMLETVNTGSVTVIAKDASANILAKAVFSIAKVKNGNDSVIYSIRPSISSVRRDQTGLPTPNQVSCEKLKRVGSSDPAITNEKFLYYITNKGVSETIYQNPIALTSSDGISWIEFILRSASGGTVLDRERVVIVRDGTDGVALPGVPGSSAYSVVLSNYMGTAILKSDGTWDYSDCITSAMLYYGTNAVPAYFNYIAGTEISVTHSTNSADFNVVSIPNNIANIRIEATPQGSNEVVAFNVFKVIKVKNSAYFQIIPSVRQVKKDKNGNLSANTVSLDVFKVEGNTRTRLANYQGGAKMRIYRNGTIVKVVDGYAPSGGFSDYPADITVTQETTEIKAIIYKNASDGSWDEANVLDSQTILVLSDGIDGIDGADQNLLPWVQDWDTNQVEIGGTHMVSPKIFAGTKNAQGQPSGVALGSGVVTMLDENNNPVYKTGIFGIKDGVITFEVDGEGNVSGDGTFSAGDSNGKVVLDPSRKGTILYDSSGKEIGRFGFKETSSNNFDFSAGEMDLYLYTNGVLTGTAKVTFDELLIQALGTTWFHVKRCTTDLGSWSEVYANLPVYPTVALADIPIGAMFIDANSSHVVKVRHT